MFSKLKAKLRALLRKSDMDRELDEEAQYHIERQTEQNIRLGMNQDEARRVALKSFGGVEQAKERSRDALGVRWIEDLWQDLRYGARMLMKRPGFTAIAVVTLALGIGANTAIFSVAHAVMWRSLPYQRPERLVMVWERMTWEKQTQPSPNEPALFLAWRESKEVFLDVAAYEDAAISHRSRFFLTGGNEPERIMGAYVSGNLFSMLGVNAALGRIFTIEDEQPGRGQVVILSDGFWRRRFGADPDVIGKTIRSRLAPAIRRAVWAEDKDLPLEEVATMEQITADATADSRFISIALGVFASIALLLGATGIYGVISCSVAERTREIGVRMALGAERFDVLRLVLAQGMKLALIGVALGLIAAFGLTRLMKSLLFGVSATDPLTFAAIAALLVLVAALACWIPARRATKVDPMVALRCD